MKVEANDVGKIETNGFGREDGECLGAPLSKLGSSRRHKMRACHGFALKCLLNLTDWSDIVSYPSCECYCSRYHKCFSTEKNKIHVPERHIVLISHNVIWKRFSRYHGCLITVKKMKFSEALAVFQG